MSDELVFTVAGSKALRAQPITLAEAGLRERRDLQEWVIEHPEILGPGVMVVTFEFDRWWTTTGERPADRLDVLGLDDSGRLVVAELKRDRAPDTIEMQAIKYAAMASRFSLATLAEQHARFLAARGTPVPDEEALTQLSAFAEDLSAETLAKPRIVLLASEFPPVVTATSVWLNEMGVDVTLVAYQAYRTGSGELVLSVSQLYPVASVEDFTVAPRQAEVRAEAATKKRTQDTSAVRRLVAAGTLVDDTALELVVRTEVNPDIRAKIEAWVAEDDRRGRVRWRNDDRAPLLWEADGASYTPSGLVRHIISAAAGVDRTVQGTKWWVDADGTDLVTLSASGKRQAYLRFWGRFLERLAKEHPEWSKARAARPESWLAMPSPIPAATYGAAFSAAGRVRVELYIDGGDADVNSKVFAALAARRDVIESRFGEALDWQELEGRQACRVAAFGDGDAADLDDHDRIVDWFFEVGERFRHAFDPEASALSA